MKDLSWLRNKERRAAAGQRRQADKDRLKRERKLQRKREAEELGKDAPEKEAPDTLESKREADDSMVAPGDEEVLADEQGDEFAAYFSNAVKPKLLITTRPRPSAKLFPFIADLMLMFPNAFFYPRKQYSLADIQRFAANRGYTHLVVLQQGLDKTCNQMLVAHLPAGPSALFKVSSIKHSQHIRGHGTRSDHLPEIILNRFQTRLGHRVGRFIGSMFQHEPEFRGRNVVTFHNQRDFIFVRHHRYKFSSTGEKARLQELGPRFTLKLRWLMAGAFDTKHGEYEWVLKRKQAETSRRKFCI